MADINSYNSQEQERYGGTNAIELSQYTTMKSLMEMLEEYYEKLECIKDIFNIIDEELEKMDIFCARCEHDFDEDKESFELGQLSPQEIEEKMVYIKKQFDFDLGVYNEITPKFEYIMESFDEPRDRLLQKKIYEGRNISFFNILGDIEKIMEKYGSLIGYKYDEDDE